MLRLCSGTRPPLQAASTRARRAELVQSRPDSLSRPGQLASPWGLAWPREGQKRKSTGQEKERKPANQTKLCQRSTVWLFPPKLTRRSKVHKEMQGTQNGRDSPEDEEHSRGLPFPSSKLPRQHSAAGTGPPCASGDEKRTPRNNPRNAAFVVNWFSAQVPGPLERGRWFFQRVALGQPQAREQSCTPSSRSTRKSQPHVDQRPKQESKTTALQGKARGPPLGPASENGFSERYLTHKQPKGKTDRRDFPKFKAAVLQRAPSRK